MIISELLVYVMSYYWLGTRSVRWNVDCKLLIFCAETVVNWLASWSFICKTIWLLYNSAITSPNYTVLPTFLSASVIVYYWVVSVFCSPSSSPHACWLFYVPCPVLWICVLMLLFCTLSVLLMMLNTNVLSSCTECTRISFSRYWCWF